MYIYIYITAWISYIYIYIYNTKAVITNITGCCQPQVSCKCGLCDDRDETFYRICECIKQAQKEYKYSGESDPLGIVQGNDISPFWQMAYGQIRICQPDHLILTRRRIIFYLTRRKNMSSKRVFHSSENESESDVK